MCECVSGGSDSVCVCGERKEGAPWVGGGWRGELVGECGGCVGEWVGVVRVVDGVGGDAGVCVARRRCRARRPCAEANCEVQQSGAFLWRSLTPTIHLPLEAHVSDSTFR